MEFSFDPSKDAHLRKPQAEPAGTTRPGPDLNTVDPSTIANERLRKAIERNRAKQTAREPLRATTQQQQPPPPPPRPETQNDHQQDSFFTNSARETEAPQPEPLPRASRTTVVSRRSVAKPEDTEFVPVKRTTRKVASQISYTTSSTSSRKKSKPVDPKYLNWLVKGSWIFCGLMILRLIFASGGVTDFYSQKNSVNDRLSELSSIKKENMQLVREIERMRSDVGFQKKLVRDNLGFIASDEFLVLFPKER